MRKVEVVAFSDNWKNEFDKEAVQILEIFDLEIKAIHHIGSTSITGLTAKPVIDMMPVIRNITKMDTYNDAMIAIGYEPKGENGLPGRRYFQKGGDYRTHHIHMYELGNPEIERHLVFRDFLRVHPTIAREYGDLKIALAEQFPYDMDAYINGKDKLAKQIEQQAHVWNKNRLDTNYYDWKVKKK